MNALLYMVCGIMVLQADSGGGLVRRSPSVEGSDVLGGEQPAQNLLQVNNLFVNPNPFEIPLYRQIFINNLVIVHLHNSL